MPGIKLKKVVKTFGRITALQGIDLDINEGEFFVLVGPTGAGKTTTLRVVSGLEKIDSGEVFIGNESAMALSPAERDVAFNKLAELYGSAHRLNTKPIKTPKKATRTEKTKLWINRNVAASGEMSIGSTPLYETKTPNRSDRTILNPQTQKPTLDPTTQYSANIGQLEGVQEQQTQQIFNMNMAYRFPSVEPQLALAQQPRLLQAGLAPSNKDALAITGALPFAVSKLVPKETKTKIKTWIKNYCEQTVQELKADPLKAQKDQYIAMILGAKKGIVMMIQAFEQPNLKQNPNAFGLEELSNRCDH